METAQAIASPMTAVEVTKGFGESVASIRPLLHGSQREFELIGPEQWTDFRLVALRAIRECAGDPEDIVTFWEFLARLATLDTKLRHQQILEVVARAVQVDAWASNFWRASEPRLSIHDLTMASKPRSAEDAQAISAALLRHCPDPIAAGAACLELQGSSVEANGAEPPNTTALEPQYKDQSISTGDAIEVVQDLCYVYDANPRLNYNLAAGMQGVVCQVDDGDALIEFQIVGKRWLLKHDLANIRRIESSHLQAEKGGKARATQHDSSHAIGRTSVKIEAKEELDGEELSDNGVSNVEARETDDITHNLDDHEQDLTPLTATQPFPASWGGLVMPPTQVEEPATLSELQAEAACPQDDCIPHDEHRLAQNVPSEASGLLGPQPTQIEEPATSTDLQMEMLFPQNDCSTHDEHGLEQDVQIEASGLLGASLEFAQQHSHSHDGHPLSDVLSRFSSPLVASNSDELDAGGCCHNAAQGSAKGDQAVDSGSNCPPHTPMARDDSSHDGLGVACTATQTAGPMATRGDTAFLQAACDEPAQANIDTPSVSAPVSPRRNSVDEILIESPPASQTRVNIDDDVASAPKRDQKRLSRKTKPTDNTPSPHSAQPQNVCSLQGALAKFEERRSRSASVLALDVDDVSGSMPLSPTSTGHTLRPAQQGLRVAVVGDGWGGGSGGYEAVITEADARTYTVIKLGGPAAWSETHVLKQYTFPLEALPLRPSEISEAELTLGSRVSQAATPSQRKRRRCPGVVPPSAPKRRQTTP